MIQLAIFTACLMKDEKISDALADKIKKAEADLDKKEKIVYEIVQERRLLRQAGKTWKREDVKRAKEAGRLQTEALNLKRRLEEERYHDRIKTVFNIEVPQDDSTLQSVDLDKKIQDKLDILENKVSSGSNSGEDKIILKMQSPEWKTAINWISLNFPIKPKFCTPGNINEYFAKQDIVSTSDMTEEGSKKLWKYIGSVTIQK